MDVPTYAQARANLKAVVDQIISARTDVVITRQVAGSIVMVVLDDGNAIEETM